MGMDYLASKRIIHSDLRASNILICENFQIRISGFSLAVSLPENKDEMTSAGISGMSLTCEVNYRMQVSSNRWF